MSDLSPDGEQISKAIAALHAPDSVIELRAFHKGRKRTDAGYFDAEHRDLLVQEAIKLNKHDAAVYVTLNEVDPQLLARAANRVQDYVQATATDANVVSRRWLLIDIDPVRPTNTSATPEQLALALKCALAIHDFLTARGWPRPVSADSGNGLHFLYRVDLPNDEPSRDLIKHCLQALAARFDDDVVKVDRSVFNAARINKLYGTVANKGDNVAVAPWRLSKLRAVPDPVETVPLELLQALAAEVAPKPKSNSSAVNGNGVASNGHAWTEGDVQAFLIRGGIEATGPEPHDGSLRWKLKACPFNSEHLYGESAVFLKPNGVLGFKCLHNSCADRHWQDLRALVDGERETRRGSNGAAHKSTAAAPTPVQPGEWPDPKPLADALPAVESFTPELIPDSLRAWVMDVAERAQAPVEYVAVSAMVSLGAALGRKIAVRPKRLDDWHEFANLWGAVIGPPSWMKSPALEEGKRPLNIIESRILKGYELTHREWEADDASARVKRDGAKDQARKAARDGKVFDKMKLVAEPIPDEPKPPRLIVNDATVPALCEVLRTNPNGVLVFRDELAGLIAELDREGMEGSRGFYLTGWSGKDGHTQDRILRGTNLQVPHVCLALLGGIQPARVAPLLKESIATGGGDGFLARFSLTVWPDCPGEYKAIDREPDADARRAAHAVYEHLYALDPANIGAQLVDGSAPYLRLEAGAAEAFTAWDVELRNRLRFGIDDGALAAHLGKYPKAVCGLALICHLADGGTGDISATAALRALAWSEFLESHARRLYGCLGQAHIEAARSLLSRIRRGDLSSPFTLREVYRRGWAHLPDAEAARAAADVLEAHHYIRGKLLETGAAGGRPTVEYHVNPAVLVPGVRP